MNDENLHAINEAPTHRLPKISQPAADEEGSSPLETMKTETTAESQPPTTPLQSSAATPNWRTPLPATPTPIPTWLVNSQTATEADGGIAPSKTRSRLGCGARLAILVALLLAGLALASNLILVLALLRIQTAAIVGLDSAIAQAEQVCGPGAAPIIFPISQTIHFKGDITLPDGMNFPFKGNIPIRTTVRITISGLPGSPTIEAPINTVVPVDTQVPLPDGMRFPIDTVVPIRQDLPIDLCVEGGPVRGFLEQTLQSLKEIRQNLLLVPSP
jgi:hypothetical protein